MRHLVAPSPGVRQCVSSSCNSYTPGFHTSLLHPFSGRRYLYAAKTPASQIRPTGLCLLSISAEELLVSVVLGRLCSTNSRYFGSYPPVAPSLCTHSLGSLVSRATSLSLCSTNSRYFGSYPPVAPSHLHALDDPCVAHLPYKD